MKQLQNSTINLQKSIKYQPPDTLPAMFLDLGIWVFPEDWLLKFEVLTRHALFRALT
jgi:hypothetical protein